MSTSKKLLIKPIIIRNNKKLIIKPQNIKPSLYLPKLKIANMPRFKQEIIYENSNCDFLKGESQSVTIVNVLNLTDKTCRTVAKCVSKGVSIETTSDGVCALIGQKNYDTVLSALGSVFNEETKVRGILALLKAQAKHNTASTQTDVNKHTDLVNVTCQTEDSRINFFIKQKQRKRIRRQQFSAYAVKDVPPPPIKKCIIKIRDVNKELKIREKNLAEAEKALPDLKLIVDEDSNISCGSISNISMSSLPSIPDLIENTSLLNDIEKVTEKTVNSTVITLQDGSNIMIPVKPEDHFHIATPEILKNVTKEERTKLIGHQVFIDLKLCLVQDNDGYNPLHVAVLNNDTDLVRRQCLALRARRETVDMLADGLTALQMAIRQNVSASCTRALLHYGADPLLCDPAGRTSLHLCADATLAQLRCLTDYCDTSARRVLQNNGSLWKPELEERTDAQLAEHLYNQIAEIFDEQGYNPLMMAANKGNAEHVLILASRAPSRVDLPSPSCGSTALYCAVSAACLHAKGSGNRTTVPDNFLKTIETLVEHGGDPTIENHSNSSVNTLLTEFNICALSMTIANKMTAMKHGKLACNTILYKGSDGRIGYKNINGLREVYPQDLNSNPSASGTNELKQDNPGFKVASVDARSKNVGVNKKSSKARDQNVNIKTDRLTGLKVIKPDQKLSFNSSKTIMSEKKTAKIVIVENLKLKPDAFPKLINRVGDSSIFRKTLPKDFVSKHPIRISNVEGNTVKTEVKIAAGSDADHESGTKRRKLN